MNEEKPEKKKEMTVFQKLCFIQGKLKAPKSQTNAFGKYKYRSLEDILEAIKPLLAEVEAAVMFQDEVVLIGERFYVKTRISLLGAKAGDASADCISTFAYSREPEIKKGMDASQITGTASSYARKYAANALFAIDDQKDSDTTNNGSGALTEPAKYNKKAEGPPKKAETVTAKAKALRKKLLEQSFFNFETEWQPHVPEGKELSFEFFRNEMLEAYNKVEDKAAFVWDLTNVNKLSETIKVSNVLADKTDG